MATTAQLSENSHPGFEGIKAALCLAELDANSNTASGMQPCLRQNGVGSRCSGKERDTESGLDYFLARYYSGPQGRFTSPDPENAASSISDPQSWNAYAYARNNPLIYVDPDGMRYRICDRDGKNCREISDDDYTKWWKGASKDFYQAGGKIYQKGVVGFNVTGTIKYMGRDQLFAVAHGAELAGPTVNAMGVAMLAFIGGAAARGTGAILTGVGRLTTLELAAGTPLATQVIFRAQQLAHAMRVAPGHTTPLGTVGEIKAAVEAAVYARQYAVGEGGLVRGEAVIRGAVHEFTGFMNSAGQIIFSNIYRK